jgi:hypothetical protein
MEKHNYFEELETIGLDSGGLNSENCKKNNVSVFCPVRVLRQRVNLCCVSLI